MSSRMSFAHLRHALTQTVIDLFPRVGDLLRDVENKVVIELRSRQ